MGQKRILLGFVETMDFVDKQDRPAAVEGQPFFRLLDRRANIFDP